MMTKKIDKIIVYYKDGTFEEIATGIHDVAPKQNPTPASAPSHVGLPTYPPGVRTIPLWPQPQYAVARSGAIENKYTIATNSNGNVDISREAGREFT